jgi:trk system potassium uptake protein TrkH
MTPARTIALGFAATILAGTVLLMLPVSSARGQWTGVVDALFTSTSAVCVTGLIVQDTPTFWSGFGQLVILVLIQIGGLGIMLLAALVGLALAHKLSVRTRMLATTETKTVGSGNFRRTAHGILATSLLIEAAVAVLLFVRFTTGYGYGPATAAWYAVFHAVSSFNNAGFALYSDSMTGFVSDPWVCLPLCAAIILGGLGFPVLRQLRHDLRRPLHWTMNTRIVLLTTVVLLVVGTVYVTVIEWNNPETLGRLDPASRVLAGFFHSVQARTAGFNSVDTGALHEETLLGTDVLMFIGGGPAGTAGGIKVTPSRCCSSSCGPNCAEAAP